MSLDMVAHFAQDSAYGPLIVFVALASWTSYQGKIHTERKFSKLEDENRELKAAPRGQVDSESRDCPRLLRNQPVHHLKITVQDPLRSGRSSSRQWIALSWLLLHSVATSRSAPCSRASLRRLRGSSASVHAL